MEIDTIDIGFYYHIYNRGINHEVIFPEEQFYGRFLDLFAEYMPQVTETLAYCLLPTHFHFLLYINDQTRTNPSNQFSKLFNAYAQWFNFKRHRNGGLFQRPFRRKRIGSNEYLRQVIYYIHRNPLHHKVAQDPTAYRFSSYNVILGTPRRGTPSGWVHRGFVLELFDSLDNFIDYHHYRFEIDGDLLFED